MSAPEPPPSLCLLSKRPVALPALLCVSLYIFSPGNLLLGNPSSFAEDALHRGFHSHLSLFHSKNQTPLLSCDCIYCVAGSFHLSPTFIKSTSVYSDWTKIPLFLSCHESRFTGGYALAALLNLPCGPCLACWYHLPRRAQTQGDAAPQSLSMCNG